MRKFIYSGLFVVVVIGSIITFPPKALLYDVRHSEYRKYFDIISGYKKGETIDFSDFADGEWETLCLFGGYTYPSVHMNKIGEIPLLKYLKQRMKSYSVFRLAELEEFELAIAYVDSKNSVHFIQMETFPKMTGEFSFEHQTNCVDKDQPTMQLN